MSTKSYYFAPLVLIGALAGTVLGAEQTITPKADGTLVDGGGFGPFDGVADASDWTFNESGYEGAITLNQPPAAIVLEHRVVFEYSLAAVSASAPVTARLKVFVRGAPRFPAENTFVSVYSYPADLTEAANDFSSGPTVFVARVSIAPFQTATEYTFDVGRIVNNALDSPVRAVAFRFQVDPNTTVISSQAFIDAVDSDPMTKPLLSIDSAIPGDADRDLDVDLDDYARFAGCLRGPGTVPTAACRLLDLDTDRDVDLTDLDLFLFYRGFFFP